MLHFKFISIVAVLSVFSLPVADAQTTWHVDNDDCGNRTAITDGNTDFSTTGHSIEMQTGSFVSAKLSAARPVAASAGPETRGISSKSQPGKPEPRRSLRAVRRRGWLIHTNFQRSP